jgi:hypothetical protein
MTRTVAAVISVLVAFAVAIGAAPVPERIGAAPALAPARRA